jgi:thiol-disulfide isomerase/thioredoxin
MNRCKKRKLVAIKMYKRIAYLNFDDIFITKNSGMKYLLGLATLLFSSAIFAQSEGTLLKNGTLAPNFSFEIEKGKTVSIDAYKGKVIVINFFATWCGPCRTELPLLQADVWDKYKDNPNFALFVFGREEGWQKVTDFKIANKFSFLMLPDENKAIYSLFATQYIPRNVIIDTEGKVVYQSTGFSEAEFDKMKKVLKKLLK